MAKWKYEGINRENKKVNGDYDCFDEKALRKHLRSIGIRPKKITQPSVLDVDLGEWLVEKGFAKPFDQKDLLNFTRQLSLMLDSGVPILMALEILFKSQKNKNLRKIIKDIADDVGQGKSLSEAMNGKKGFDKLYCNLVKAGEAGGILDIILMKLTIFLEKQDKTKSQIKSAMTYPALVVIVGSGVVFALMVYVVPQMKAMVEASGQELPVLTQIVMSISKFLSTNFLNIIFGVFIGFAVLSRSLKTPTGKKVFDRLMMQLPIFSPVIIKGNLSSFTRTLATMLSSGVPLIDALEICSNTIDNGIIAEDIKQVRKAVVEGKTLTEPLLKIKYFPEMITQMVKVGEQTGDIDKMLEKVSGLFEDDVDEAVSNMTKMIEPIILVVLGGIVAVILIAMYLPIFTSAQGM